ncbi:MAG: LPS-assembly protein LptD [Pseudomonadota bacterium]|nr:LPS-assembly protein LptD [Pseudomonadota bacterium]
MPSPRLLVPAAAALCLTLLPARAGAAESAATCTAAEAAAVLCPGDTPPIRAAQPVDAQMDSGKVSFEFGRLSYDGQSTIHFTEGVQAQQAGRTLSASEVDVDYEANRIEARGSVEYRDDELVVQGDAGSFSDGNAEFEGVQFQLPGRPARGGARAMSVDGNGVLRLDGVEYTTCPPGHDDWTIGAASVSINTARSTAVARDARLEFFGVPLLRLPVISFPVGNARKSGVLFPNIGSSTSGGVELAVPYYFNLTPQQDFTATPTWYSNRGVDFGGEYRYLARFGSGTVQGNLLPGDNRDGGTRSRLKINSVSELPGQWRLTLDAENVSDTRYLEDFARGTSDASTPFLPRSALLAWRDDQLDLGILWRNFQTLYADLPQADRPHTELPRLFANGDWQLAGSLPLNYGAQVEAVNFRHDSDVQGWRLHAAPQLALDYVGTGWFMRPAATLQATHYRLHDAAPGVDTTPTRTLPVLSFDTGLVFEGNSGKRRQRRVTLEPRMMYLYAPYRDQDELPVFDTGEPDLNWVELFRDNRYVGIDRISDANQVSAGVTARLYSSQTGQRYISATLGQVYYLDKPRVLLPDEPEDPGRTSDLIAEVELASLRNWNVNTGWQWDPQGKRTERAEVRLQYRPESRSVLNFGYRFQRDRMEQVEFSAAWPLNDSWRLYGRSLYSLRDEQIIENFAGFEYGSCCWAVRAVARDYVSRRSGERDRSIYLQLELKGLSNVGLAADAFLERAIRGYSTRRRR